MRSNYRGVLRDDGPVTAIQYADLEKHLQDWLDLHCEDINVWWGPHTAKHMATAARAVVEALQDARDDEERNG